MFQKDPIGTVGLGLMGSSIATCLLAAGHHVTALIRTNTENHPAKKRISNFLQQLYEQGHLKDYPDQTIKNLVITDDIRKLSQLEVVIESIYEDPGEKVSLFRRLEEVIPPTSIIASNTSAIPISTLQQGMKHPERVLGVHWGEPAHITRFMEVICGDQSELKYAEKIIGLAKGWGKEPALIKKDIRGFITNRLMYAMMREAFHLVENGYASIEDVDKSVRNDLGYWITFAGPFRFMDLTGIPAYLNVMKDLFPDLCNSGDVPQLIKNIVDSGGTGVQNAKGFYPYTPDSAEKWEKLFVKFSFEIRELAEKYPQNIGDL